MRTHTVKTYDSLLATSQHGCFLQASLTDGTNVSYGCVIVTSSGQTTPGCTSNDTRSQSFVFQPGERVTNLTLWPGYSPQKVANQRGGAINLVTSQVWSPTEPMETAYVLQSICCCSAITELPDAHLCWTGSQTVRRTALIIHCHDVSLSCRQCENQEKGFACYTVREGQTMSSRDCPCSEQGRTFDFGMTHARLNPVSVAVGSGIPCGVAPRAGTAGSSSVLPLVLQANVFHPGLQQTAGGSPASALHSALQVPTSMPWGLCSCATSPLQC